jgi:hypothetical protein
VLPGPLSRNLFAVAIEVPSGDRASAVQIVSGPQPHERTQITSIKNSIGLRFVELLANLHCPNR